MQKFILPAVLTAALGLVFVPSHAQAGGFSISINPGYQGGYYSGGYYSGGYYSPSYAYPPVYYTSSYAPSYYYATPTYYPYVKECPSAWQPVTPQPQS